LPLDRLPGSPTIAFDADDTALRGRLERLERLLETHGPAQPPDLSLAGSGAANSKVFGSLASPRLPPLSDEIERRTHSDEWDAADAVTARVLLDELTASLRGCRLVATAASARLRDVQSALREGQRLLERAAPPVDEAGSTMPSMPQSASGQE